MHRPGDETELAALVADAAAAGRRLELRGGGTKAAIGATREAEMVDLSAFAGVVDYDPGELILTVRPATPLAEVQALVAGQGQMLAFEPWDHGPLFGRPAGAATIGGVVAAGVAGPRRVSAGAVRDHLLGCVCVSGRGERFVAGAKVVKNVTGYDLPKLLAGSWGRLAALTELTLKVLPAPRQATTWTLPAADAPAAWHLMCAAMGAPLGVAAAAWSPARGRVSLRVEGFEPSVRARLAALDALLPGGAADAGDPVWAELTGDAPSFPDRAESLWRVNVPASRGADLAARLLGDGAQLVADWAGALLWVYSDDPAIRNTAAAAGAHATLVRGQGAPIFHPQPAPLAALEARVRRAFDPAGVFETGRF